MARIKTSAYPVNAYSKYTIKELHNLIKSYNIPNYARLKKQELIELLNSKFTLQNNTLVLKQPNNEYFDFSPDLFSDFNESQNPLLQSMDLPVAIKRPPPATKGNRKVLPTTANRKIMPTGRGRGRPKKNPI